MYNVKVKDNVDVTSYYDKSEYLTNVNAYLFK